MLLDQRRVGDRRQGEGLLEKVDLEESRTHTVVKQTEEVILSQRGSPAKIRACLQKDVKSHLRAECVGEVTGGTCLGQIRRNGAA